jgi:hypothetical protein
MIIIDKWKNAVDNKCFTYQLNRMDTQKNKK